MKKYYAVVCLIAWSSSAVHGLMNNRMNDFLKKENSGMETRIRLKAEASKNSAAILNMLLSDEYLFLTKLLKYHWNVTGPYFGSLHKLFDDQYNEVFKMVDAIAERVRSIGHKPFGTLQEFSQNSRLQETPGELPSTTEMIADLVRGHEAIICAMREAIPDIEEQQDFGTMDFLTGLMESHEKMAWFLRAHLEK